MFELEKELKAILNKGNVKLFKYHYEGEIDDIPDVLDYLYDYKKRTKEKLAQIYLEMHCNGLNNLCSKLNYNRIKGRIEIIDEFIDRILDNDDIYYSNLGFNYLPISMKIDKVPVYSAKLINNKVHLEIIGEITEYSFNDDYCVYDYGELEEVKDSIHINCDYTGDGYYMKHIISNDSYFMCKDCGKYFTLSGAEITWYNTNNYNLPKRCVVCWFKRKSVELREVIG